MRILALTLLLGLFVPPAPVGAASPDRAASPIPTPRVKRALKRIMAEREYRRLVRQAREERREKPEQRLEKRPVKKEDEGCNGGGAGPDLGGGAAGCGGQAVSGLLYVFVGLALAVVLGVIIYSLLRRQSRSRRRSGAADEALAAGLPRTPPGELPADAYLRRARELAAAGDFRQAVRQLLLGGMSWIERAGLIRFRQGLTNYDYVRVLGERPRERQGFLAVVRQFEEIYFGRREATAERFQAGLDGYRAGFEQDEATTPTR